MSAPDVLPAEPVACELVEIPTTPEEAARNRAESENFRRNVAWFGKHAAEIRAAHAGRYIYVVGEELFVGEDPREVLARAKQAHPEQTGGYFSMWVNPERGPRVYADQR